jgi:hypothetical protein
MFKECDLPLMWPLQTIDSSYHAFEGFSWCKSLAVRRYCQIHHVITEEAALFLLSETAEP